MQIDDTEGFLSIVQELLERPRERHVDLKAKVGR